MSDQDLNQAANHKSNREVFSLDSDLNAKPSHLRDLKIRTGRVGAIETLGAVDGPGLRTVVFMQGCPLRCKFCHNIDLAQHWNAPLYEPQKLFDEIIKNQPYWQQYDYNDLGKAIDMQNIPGGVTFSGGEPTMQTDFLVEVMKLLKARNVHIAIDSCLYTSPHNIDKLLPYVDLWMVSIKQLDDESHQKLTGVSNKLIMKNIKYLDAQLSYQSHNPKLRVRFVLIPSIVSDDTYLERLGSFVKGIDNLELFELLPYSLIGKQKWVDIYGDYGLEGIEEPSSELVQHAKAMLEEMQIPVKL